MKQSFSETTCTQPEGQPLSMNRSMFVLSPTINGIIHMTYSLTLHTIESSTSQDRGRRLDRGPVFGVLPQQLKLSVFEVHLKVSKVNISRPSNISCPGYEREWERERESSEDMANDREPMMR